MSGTSGEHEYIYRSGEHSHTHAWLWPALQRELARRPVQRVFDVGCGNGAMAGRMQRLGLDVTAIDASASGIAEGRRHYPAVQFEQESAYSELAARFGRFPLVVSLEVVEHLYDPRRFASVVYDLVEPGGTAIVSTPYHGYMKNLALAISGRLDAHFTALWDGGHIKFWSMATLRTLLCEAGFADVTFERVGRIPLFAKSMVAIARRPTQR